jgi:hypothetical protein
MLLQKAPTLQYYIIKLNKIIMKKTLIMSIIFVSFGIMSIAQSGDSDDRNMMTFGIKAGMNYSNVWDERGEDFRADSKAGFAGGVFLGIPIGTYFGFQPELLISQKGFQASGTFLTLPYSYKRTTTYLDVPLQIQFKPIEYITFVAGPQYSYLMHAKNVYKLGGTTTEQEQEFDNENIRKNILGFVFGADINISHLVVSGRIGWDLQSNNGDGTSTTPRYKNTWLQLALGFKF